MKIKHYEDTDSLYIDLSEKTSAESMELAPGIVVDLDADNHIVGIDIDHASEVLDLSSIEIKVRLQKSSSLHRKGRLGEEE